MEINIKNALIIIDVQNDYFPNGKMELKNTEKTLNKILQLEQSAHENKELIIYIKHINGEKASFFLPNTNGVEIHKDLNTKFGEVIIKNELDSFMNTKLKEVLDFNKITNLTICGMMTYMCVDTTVRSAYEKGYKVKLVSEGCTTKNLTFNNVEVDYKDVNISYFAALSRFAEVI